MSLRLTPISREEAKAFITEHHRTHNAPVSHKFSVAVSDGDQVVGVAMVGRPVSRVLDDGWTLEVTRCCVAGSAKNAASMLYGASWRAAKALGYTRLITYTMDNEPGTSLTAAGWKALYYTTRDTWNTPARPRVDIMPAQRKLCWEAQ